ncbi:hypothetical protein LLG90_27485, partial [Aromatoleum toluclasticum]|uniref:hypothetical protein n=1 Tax=Aromatoleum toluclasticum TaxID=92003 RepID=UPI001D1873FA
SALMDGRSFLTRMVANPTMSGELGELATYLDERAELDPEPLPGALAAWPLTLHAAYQIREIPTTPFYRDPTRARRPGLHAEIGPENLTHPAGCSP